MSQTAHTEITITGYLVGSIWWPAGAECWKDFHHSITDEAPRMGTRQLRDHVLAILCDGDFQSASIAQGEVTIRQTRHDGRITTTRAKSIPLSKFPTLADCLHPDPDWLPTYFDDEEKEAA